MQTFLTNSDYRRAASDLDSRRLNKQLLEGRQILAAQAGMTKGWVYHPATKMWLGGHFHLYEYLEQVKYELEFRGIETQKNWDAINQITATMFLTLDKPWWLTDIVTLDRVITSHRANLYLKDSEHYFKFYIDYKVFSENRDYFTCCDRCNYYWPTHIKDN